MCPFFFRCLSFIMYVLSFLGVAVAKRRLWLLPSLGGLLVLNSKRNVGGLLCSCKELSVLR